jgi:hypothetical protein
VMLKEDAAPLLEQRPETPGSIRYDE